MKKKAALHSLGCKVNAYETEAMRQLLEKAGYEIVPFAPGADVYVINTCTVTNIADRKSRQMLHRARKMNPQAIVVAAGCYVQTAQEPVEEDAAIDIVLGNNCKTELVEALRYFEEVRRGAEVPEQVYHAAEMLGELRHMADKPEQTHHAAERTGEIRYTADKPEPEHHAAEKPGELWRAVNKPEQTLCTAESEKVEHTADEARSSQNVADMAASRRASGSRIDINRTKEYEPLSIERTLEHTRAYIKVQDGCNQFCSYCIIPYARGRVRSRALEDILTEVRTLAANGCREVVLTGIHLSSYGTDLGMTLTELIQAVHEVPGIERIRLGSLEPGIVTEEFAATLASLPKVCPHFHLSLQSGCNATLKRMNRRYTAEEYEARCGILRNAFADPAITTDVIVGFPGETEGEFKETVDFLTRIRLYETHIFKYSRRHGTRAASMPDQIPEPEKGIRSETLIALGDRNRQLFERLFAGREVEALFEEKTVIGGQEYYTGYTRQYVRMAVPADADYENALLTGRLAQELAPHLFLLNRGMYP